MKLTDGLVTLLFTDIEGGVGLWEAGRDAMAAASARHDRMVREQVEASGGHVFQAVGEAHRAGFADPVAALVSAVAIQRAAGAELWPSGLPVRVCVALHCGVCAERDGDYAGPVVNRAARLLDAGHGGQVLVTAAAYALLAGRLYFPTDQFSTYREGIDRVVAFARTHPVSHILGAHIEMTGKPGVLIEDEAPSHPDERPLDLPPAALTELQAALDAMGDAPRQEAHADFVVFPLPPRPQPPAAPPSR